MHERVSILLLGGSIKIKRQKILETIFQEIAQLRAEQEASRGLSPIQGKNPVFLLCYALSVVEWKPYMSK